ncbi:nucleotidyltransferase family protein [Candidatus Woesearchaeota archaeon]|nr:nucleotidyltransferase family protein [Candidatus Woesearchaeota archaeon]
MKLKCRNKQCRHAWDYGGKAKFYASCPRCKSSVRISKSSILQPEEIIRKIEEHREKIRQFGVKRLMLFGSHARNKASEESDIDFLVEFEKGRGLFDDYVHLLQFLQDTFRREIDLVEPGLIREELKPYILGGKKIEAKI